VQKSCTNFIEFYYHIKKINKQSEYNLTDEKREEKNRIRFNKGKKALKPNLAKKHTHSISVITLHKKR
jgi:hypothetical protein